jgi:hypothetical protein
VVNGIPGIVRHYPHCHITVDVIDYPQLFDHVGEVAGAHITVGSPLDRCEIKQLRHRMVA